MTSPAGGQMTSSATLSHDLVQRIRSLAARVDRIDGAPPLDEHAELQLSHARAGTTHVLIERDEDVSGYAQVQGLGPGEQPAAEILVGLDGDRPALAAALFTAAEGLAGSGPMSVWARGETTPVRAEAEARGYRPERTLLTMSRALAGGADAPAWPGDVGIRAFVPGEDDAAWLAVNARAFAHHREQGRWTQDDLGERIAEPWFDPAGFLLLVDAGGAIIGFHWTKLHPAPGPGRPPVGEVYVLGVDPSAQGRHLSRPLLLAGLAHLRTTGAETAILYVDEDNAGAVRLYEKAGFTVTRRQTQYRRLT